MERNIQFSFPQDKEKTHKDQFLSTISIKLIISLSGSLNHSSDSIEILLLEIKESTSLSTRFLRTHFVITPTNEIYISLSHSLARCRSLPSSLGNIDA